MILETTTTLYIKVNNISDIYPAELQGDIEDWLRSKAVELGVGRQIEYYCFQTNKGSDIEFDFYVTTNKNSFL